MSSRRPGELSWLLLLAAVQFTHILDFMIVMPLGPQLLRDLGVNPSQFSAIVSAYAIAAGAMGLLAAPFVDRFERKSLLLLMYAGFLGGTLATGLVHTAESLLIARAVCGAFGGVSGALVMALVGDLVPPERRGRSMGIIASSFSLAAALGVPLGLLLATTFRWEMPFLLVAAVGAVVWALLAWRLPAVARQGREEERRGAFVAVLRTPNAWRGLLFMSTLVFGHFTIIPFLPIYLVGNVGLPEPRLFLVYLVGGVLTAFTAPTFGRLADRRGLLPVFTVVVLVAAAVTLTLSHLGHVPLVVVLSLSGAFFVFASGRFVPAQAMLSLAVPPSQRGAFMSLVACVRDLASGLTSLIGGWLVTKTPAGGLEGFATLGWMAAACSVVSIAVARRVRPVEALQRTGEGSTSGPSVTPPREVSG